MDYYLNNKNCIKRLTEEFEKHGQLIIAYDFDNTVYDYHKEGHKYDEVINLLRRADELGCYLIVFTAASEERYKFIQNYLKDNNIPYDCINDNHPETSNFNDKKIYYNILLDDRAGLSASCEILNQCFININKKSGGNK